MVVISSRRVATLLAGQVSVAVIVLCALASSAAGAYETHSGPVTVSVTAEKSGDSLRVDVRTLPGVQLYEIRAHVCLPGSNVHTNFDFGFEGRVCPNVAIGSGDVDASAAFPNGVRAGTLDRVRVGTGTAHWVNELGFPGSIQCDAAHLCDLVVRAQITNATVFVTVPLCGTRPCRAPGSGSHRHAGGVWLWAAAIGGLLVVVWIVRARRRRAPLGTS